MQRLQEEMGPCPLVAYLCQDLMKAPSEMYYLVGGGVEVGQRPAKGKAVVSQVGLEVRLRVNQMDWKGLWAEEGGAEATELKKYMGFSGNVWVKLQLNERKKIHEASEWIFSSQGTLCS